MLLKEKIYKLKGKVQHYAWGGYQFLPQLLSFNNSENKPCAEYWMGAHPSASSEIITAKDSISLNKLINEYPAETITNTVFQRFGELPYLFKILDVQDMLSIQVHPAKEEAVKGFEKEEADGIPITAPHRNYKDKNHKPEVMIALGEFWLLHGFKQKAELEKTLKDIQEFNILLPLYKTNGLKALYRFVMEMEQPEIDSILTTLIKTEMANKAAGLLSKQMPGWWAAKLFEGKTEIKNIDRGVFSIYFFNIVKAKKGEAVFQAAGVPHAYLEGQNVELMANSDNVLRGGLTPKHVDVPELMKHTLFEGITPNILKGKTTQQVETLYPCPVPDFGISKIEMNSNQNYSALSVSMEIAIVIEGNCIVNSEHVNIALKHGECFVVLPDENYTITTSKHCTLYKAFVP